jgi:Protein of unknown function (DUF2877)
MLMPMTLMHDPLRSVARYQFTAGTIGCRVPRTDRCGRVGAVFKHACMVMLEGGGVVALLAPHVGHVAHAIRLAVDEPIDRYIRIGTPARIWRSAIVFGADVAVTLSSARIWTSAVRLGMCARNKGAFNTVALARNVLLDLAPQSRSEFLAAVLQIGRPVTALGVRVSAALPRLALATRAHDANHALLLVRELLGLGPGLTPAGDDFIVGWLAGLTLGAQSPTQHEFLAAMCTGVEALSYVTTPISRQHLADACALMFSERLSEVCVAIASDASRPALQSSMTAQLAVGATSGADAGAGLIFALFDCAGGSSASSHGSRDSGRASCPQHT